MFWPEIRVTLDAGELNKTSEALLPVQGLVSGLESQIKTFFCSVGGLLEAMQEELRGRDLPRQGQLHRRTKNSAS